MNGQGVPQDYAQAMTGSEGGGPGQRGRPGQHRRSLRQGYGVAQDYAQAMTWYRKAADQGNALAQVDIGDLYRNGHGVPQDYAQALTGTARPPSRATRTRSSTSLRCSSAARASPSTSTRR